MGVGVVQPSLLSLFMRLIGGFLFVLFGTAVLSKHGIFDHFVPFLVSKSVNRLFRLKTNNVKSLDIDILFISLNKFLNQLIQNAMKTYSIIGKTNGYIANRDSDLNGKTIVAIKSGLTLKEAQHKLLDMFVSDYEQEIGVCPNWGTARRKRKYSTTTFNDGTRSYEFDSRYYSIEEETEELKEKFNL